MNSNDITETLNPKVPEAKPPPGPLRTAREPLPVAGAQRGWPHGGFCHLQSASPKAGQDAGPCILFLHT